MNYQRVFSGNTELIDGQREEWYKSLKGERIEWEDLAAAHSTGELLEQLDTVPLYEYIVNYLRCIWEDAGKDTVYENVIRLLTERISQEFSKNRMPEEKCRPSHIREMLTTEWSREWDNFENAASRRIFELALGLQLPAQDVEQLLQKAVKRAGFNYYDPEELFVWCALQFAPGRCYLCFEALMRDYKMIAPAKEKKEKRNFANTAEVRDQLEDVIRSNIGGRLYSSEECEPGTMDPAFEIFLSGYKAEVPARRTAAVVFQKLFKEFLESHKAEILSFKSVDRGSEEYARGILRIEYRADREIRLPAGTVYYAEKGREHRKIRFLQEKEEVLPVRNTVEEDIPVRGTKEYIILPSKKETPGYAGKGAVLKPGDAAAEVGVTGAVTATTLKYTGRAGESVRAQGVIRVTCRPGSRIPEGTRFLFGNYTYETLKEVQVQAGAEISIRSEGPGAGTGKMAETGEVRHMEKMPEGILSVANPKPIYMRQPTENISKELFRDFLYVKDASRLNAYERKIDGNLLGSWFTDTEMTSVRLSKIQKQAEESKGMTRGKMERSEVRREDLITMTFLNFCTDTDVQAQAWQYQIEAEPETVYQDFLRYVNPLLRQCGMMPFYLENPYERLLAYLMQTDTPVDSLRNMWKIVNARKGDENDESVGKNTAP